MPLDASETTEVCAYGDHLVPLTVETLTSHCWLSRPTESYPLVGEVGSVNRSRKLTDGHYASDAKFQRCCVPQQAHRYGAKYPVMNVSTFLRTAAGWWRAVESAAARIWQDAGVKSLLTSTRALPGASSRGPQDPPFCTRYKPTI